MEKKKSTRKSKVKIYTEKGGLKGPYRLSTSSVKGYSIHDTMVNRRSILKNLLLKTPYSTIIKRLNVLAIYNKNRYPETSSKIKRDMSFLQKTFSKKRSVKKPSAKKRSVKKPSAKKRSVKKPSAKKRSVKKPSAKKRSVKKPSAKKRSVKKPSAKKRSVKKGGRTMKGMCCCRRQCKGMCRWQGALSR
jgi:hypothetical protein